MLINYSLCQELSLSWELKERQLFFVKSALFSNMQDEATMLFAFISSEAMQILAWEADQRLGESSLVVLSTVIGGY